MTKFQPYSCPTLITNKTKGCTKIKQYNCRLMIDRKGTCQNWCALWKLCMSSKVNISLSHLHDLFLALALVVLLRILTLGRLLISGTSPGEVRKTSANETTVVTICAVELLIIWSWPKLLLLVIWPWPRLLLLRHRRSNGSLLLGWPENPSA